MAGLDLFLGTGDDATRAQGLAMGAALLGTHGVPPGVLMSRALMAGQQARQGEQMFGLKKSELQSEARYRDALAKKYETDAEAEMLKLRMQQEQIAGLRSLYQRMGIVPGAGPAAPPGAAPGPSMGPTPGAGAQSFPVAGGGPIAAGGPPAGPAPAASGPAPGPQLDMQALVQNLLDVFPTGMPDNLRQHLDAFGGVNEKGGMIFRGNFGGPDAVLNALKAGQVFQEAEATRNAQNSSDLMFGGTIAQRKAYGETSGQNAANAGVPLGTTATAGAVEDSKRAGELVTVIDPTTRRPIQIRRDLMEQMRAGGMPVYSDVSEMERAFARQAPQPLQTRAPDGSMVTGYTSDVLGTPGGVPPQPGVGTGRQAPTTPTTNERIIEERRVEDKTGFRKTFDEAQAAALLASQQKDALIAQRALIPTQTGPIAQMLLPVRQVLASLTGLGEDQVAKLAQTEGFQALSNQILISQQQKFKGAVSDAEFSTARKAVASLGNTEKSNRMLIDFALATQEKAIWYAESLGKLDERAAQAEQAGNRFDYAAALRSLNRMRDSDATSVWGAPSMTQWRAEIDKAGRK